MRPNIINIANNINKTRAYLISVNFLLVLVLIILNNFKIIPLRTGDFAFFAIITFVFFLYRPGWGFLFFVGTIALENINLAPESFGIIIRPYQLIGSLVILSVAFRFFSKKLYFNLPKFGWYDYALLVVVFSGFFSIFNASDKIFSFKLAIIFASFFVFYYLTRVYIQNSEDIKRVIPFFISSGVAIIFYGIWQNWQFISNLTNFETMPGRPNATFTEADWLGIFLVLFISVVYALIYLVSSSKFQASNQIQNPNFKIQNLVLYFLLIISYLILILTVSRSAWLGAFFSLIIFLWIIFTDLRMKKWHWKETISIKLGIILSLIISIATVHVLHLTNFQLTNRIQSTGTGLQKITISCQPNLDCIVPQTIESESDLNSCGCHHINLEEIDTEKSKGYIIEEIYRKDPNVQTRKEIYQKSWHEIKNHPILGIGWGSIGSVLGKDARGSGLNSSNIFLEIWLGSGIIGFLAFIIFWVNIIFNAIKNYYFSSEILQKSINLFIIISWLGLTVCNLFNAGTLLGFLWVWMGLSLSKINENRN